MKKFIAAISAAAMLFGAVAGLTACGGGHEHIWDGGEVTTAATCVSNGVKTFKCTVEGCGESYTEPVAKTGHDFSGGLVNVNAEGHATKCANCEEVDLESIVPHNFENQPLISDGKETYHQNCADCGAPSESVAHVWGEEITVIEATFYNDGKTERVCACGDKTEIVIPALDSMHASVDDASWQFGTGEITNFDTCEYTFTQLTQKNADNDGYTNGTDEIKADWFSNGSFDTVIIITYTFEQDVTASVVASFKGVGDTANNPEAAISDYSLRIGLKAGTALKDVAFKRGTQFTTETEPYVKNFKQGDTLVFIFKHETDGWDQGNYIITVNKAQPTVNAG